MPAIFLFFFSVPEKDVPPAGIFLNKRISGAMLVFGEKTGFMYTAVFR
ncbi:MAG: hypothetical protein ACI92Z_002580 [Paracoccaceae bacterium]|jgi:hypothetical protein